MKQLTQKLNYFNTFEKCLWLTSVLVVTVSFLLGGTFDALNCFTTLLGVTALLFMAKGNVIGQMLTVVFGLLYGLISYQCAYYGEMITYLGMTAPMAALAAIQWLKNPYQKGKNEVAIASLTPKRVLGLLALTAVVTVLFYFILGFFGTASLALSTASVATSFFAVALTYCRSHWYAVAYAANDLVLIGLWVIASLQDAAYLTIVICFVMFFVNDLYAYYNWRRMMCAQGLMQDVAAQ